MKTKVLVVAGPTASGKTGLGIALARRLDGEIVCADSMQIYTGMPIATAAPTAAERQAAVHIPQAIHLPWSTEATLMFPRKATRFSTILMASYGQTFSHNPQATQVDSSTLAT